MKRMAMFLAKALLGWPLRLLPAGLLAKAFYVVLQGVATARPPADSLRFLLSLQRYLDSLHGLEAVRYGEGIHTKHRHVRYSEFFTARLAQGERVLDIGSGTGFLSHAMAEAGARVTGIEIVEKNVAAARERFSRENLSFVHGDALKWLPEEPVDTVVMSNVLEHLPERARFLREVQARLEPKRWLIRVPLFERDWRLPLMRELGLDWRSDDTHETEHTVEEFKAELAEAGLRIVHLETKWSEIWCEARP